MTHNPYAPPTATVADILPPPMEKPRQVVWAVRLLWTSFILSIPDVVYQQYTEPDPSISLTAIIIGQAAVFAVYLWLIFKLSAGRNWARIMLLVLTALGTLLFVVDPSILKSHIMRGVVTVICTLVDVAAMALVFVGAGRQWFKQR